jgi:hypothetical protein
VSDVAIAVAVVLVDGERDKRGERGESGKFLERVANTHLKHPTKLRL